MIFSKRKARHREDAARARGENVDYLTGLVPQEFRMKLWYALGDLVSVEDISGIAQTDYGLSLLTFRLVREYGIDRLSAKTDTQPGDEIREWITDVASGDQLMDVVEQGPWLAEQIGGRVGNVALAAAEYRIFRDTVRHALHEHKLKWDIVGTEVVERDSAELHAEVVVPALILIQGRPRFADVNREYKNALDELGERNWAAAIADANGAVETTLRIVTGLEQGHLPALLDEARRRAIFGPEEDGRLRKFVEGFTALSDMRSQEGDSYAHAGTRDAAWLAVHWAGALIVFIVERVDELEM